MENSLTEYLEKQKKKHREYMRVWVAKNRDKWRKYNATWQKRNRKSRAKLTMSE